MTQKVNILLSTFNGERFLVEQLESILSQTYKNVVIHVRDDGSSDRTREILSNYAFEYPQYLKVDFGNNLGVIKSFFELLCNSDSKCDYFAFCDQDDVWKKDKISNAIAAIEDYSSHPAMYCSNYYLVDENLNIIRCKKKNDVKPSFYNALVENIATGCTIVINKHARELIAKQVPKKALMHDWWFYLVVSAFGAVIYDSNESMFYRQHSSNVVGVKSNLLDKWISRVKRFKARQGMPFVTEQAEEFRNIFGSLLSLSKKEGLNRFLDERNSFWGRLAYAVKGESYRQSFIDNFIFKILIILNCI
jgi:glycosyltransferase involved in cell wall biosynthesis